MQKHLLWPRCKITVLLWETKYGKNTKVANKKISIVEWLP